jgi:hypothetical protein
MLSPSHHTQWWYGMYPWCLSPSHICLLFYIVTLTPASVKPLLLTQSSLRRARVDKLRNPSAAASRFQASRSAAMIIQSVCQYGSPMDPRQTISGDEQWGSAPSTDYSNVHAADIRHLFEVYFERLDDCFVHSNATLFGLSVLSVYFTFHYALQNRYVPTLTRC